MGGVDAIVFTAGIGENSPMLRKMVCDKLDYLGVKLNDKANSIRGQLREISLNESKVKVWVIPTNEEQVIAEETYKLIA